MSDEGQKFTPRRQPMFPRVILRAYVGPNRFMEWDLTPPDGAGWFDCKFEVMQEDGLLHINDGWQMMQPRAPDL